MTKDAEQPIPARRRRNMRRNVLLLVLGVFLVAVLGSAAFVSNLAHSFDNKAQEIPTAFPNETLRPVKPTEGPAAQAMNVLLLGSDSRGDSLNLAESGNPSNQRSDTMMWVHIPADRKNVFLMSIMRDTWVDIPGFGQAKINAAMAYGGVPLVVQTLEGMFNNRIDHVAIMDFEGFKAVTDALGGVEVDVPLRFTSLYGGYTFQAGPQKLNGDKALAFVRERYAFADGDYQRVKDQQIFLKAVLNTIVSPKTLTNPLRVSDLVGKTSPYVSVDAGLNSAAVGALAISLKGIRAADVMSFTLTTLGTDTSTDGQSIVLKDQDAIDAISKALSEDSLGAYLKSAGLG